MGRARRVVALARRKGRCARRQASNAGTALALGALLDGFAAGALLVMLVDSMIPEATEKFGRKAGLVTALGFACAAALSGVST